MNMIVKILRIMFLFLDGIIYWVVNMVYQLFMRIAQSTIFSPKTINQFATRIYVLLGVIMLFRVAIAMVNYIVNPDQFSDAKEGGASLIKKMVMVLVGIIAVPYVFDMAFTLQRIVLSNNVIGSIILGSSVNSGDLKDRGLDPIEIGGRVMSYQSFSAFFRVDDYFDSEGKCTMPVPDSGNPHSYQQWIGECQEAIETASETTHTKGYASTVAETLAKAYDEVDMYVLTRSPISGYSVKVNNEDTFVIDYTLLISSACGVFIVWILIVFCIDIAVRAIKLGFLQLIAPIPLVSYLAPGEKGKKTLNNWVSECTKTYIDLFIRLAAIFFVIFIIVAICTPPYIQDVVTGDKISDPFVYVFIILGALMFAKQIPELLKNLLGVDLGGKGFTLNPMKKIREGAVFGDKVAGGLGLAGRTAGRVAGLGLAGGMGLAKDIGKAGLGVAGKGASKIDNATGNKISGFGNKVGSRVGGMGQSIGNWGKQFGNDIVNSKAGKWIGTYTKDARKAVGEAFSETKDEFEDYGKDLSAGFRNATGMGQSAAKRQQTRLKNLENIKKQIAQVNDMSKARAANTTAGKKDDFLTSSIKAGNTSAIKAADRKVFWKDSSGAEHWIKLDVDGEGKYMKAVGDRTTVLEQAIRNYAIENKTGLTDDEMTNYGFDKDEIKEEAGKMKFQTLESVSSINNSINVVGGITNTKYDASGNPIEKHHQKVSNAAELKSVFYGVGDAVTQTEAELEKLRAKGITPGSGSSKK